MRKRIDIPILLGFIGVLIGALAILPLLAAEPVEVLELKIESIEHIEMHTAAGQATTIYKEIEQIPLDKDLQEYMQGLCERKNLSFAFALMVMESESSFDAEAVGDESRSIGYFQINKINWERMAEEYGYDVQDPRGNIAAGVAILSELFEKYDDPYMVLLCYKCGERRGKELFYQGIYDTEQFSCKELCERATEIERYME